MPSISTPRVGRLALAISLFLLVPVLPACASTSDEPDSESSDGAQTRSKAPAEETFLPLACGATEWSSFSSGGLLGVFISRLEAVYAFKPQKGQKVELSVTANYDPEFGIQATVTNADGKVVTRVKAESSLAMARFSADGSGYRVSVKPLLTMAFIYDWSQDPHTYRWVPIERSNFGVFGVSLTCSSCRVGGTVGRCIQADECAGLSTPGLCPGAADIQCCTGS